MPSEPSRLRQRKMGYPGHSTRVRAPLLLAGVGLRRPRPQFCSPGRRYLRGVWLALGASDFHTPCVLAYAKGTHVSEAHPRGADHLELPFLRRPCHAFSISYDLHRDFCFSMFVPENAKFHILVSTLPVFSRAAYLAPQTGDLPEDRVLDRNQADWWTQYTRLPLPSCTQAVIASPHRCTLFPGTRYWCQSHSHRCVPMRK